MDNRSHAPEPPSGTRFHPGPLPLPRLTRLGILATSLCALSAVLVMTGCSPQQQPVIGQWKFQTSGAVPEQEMSVTLSADKTAKIIFDSGYSPEPRSGQDSIAGSWKTEGDSIHFTSLDKSDAEIFKILLPTSTSTDGSIIFIYDKAKDALILPMGTNMKFGGQMVFVRQAVK